MNECDKFPCDVNENCINQIGSFKCSCLRGFIGNGSRCLGVSNNYRINSISIIDELLF